MKKNSRKLALEWWRELSFDKQKKLMIGHFTSIGHFKGGKIFSLSAREVEIIWKSEKQK
jgi:hypothetical protein